MITQEDLRSIATDALEQLAFVMVTPTEAADGADCRHATISYSGAASGTVTLSTTMGFLRELAAGLLGEEPEDVNPEDAEGALLELGNIIGGSVIERLGATDERYMLGLPSAASGPSTSSDARTDLESMDGMLTVCWSGVAAGAADREAA